MIDISLRRFTYENLVTTSPTSRKHRTKKFFQIFPISGSDGWCVQKAGSNSSQNISFEITRHSY